MSMPLVRITDDSCGDTPPPAGIEVYDEGTECRPRRLVEILAVGEKVTATVAYSFDASTQTCAPFDPSTLGSSSLYPLGNALNPDEVFPRVERIIRD